MLARCLASLADEIVTVTAVVRKAPKNEADAARSSLDAMMVKSDQAARARLNRNRPLYDT
jgi:hypothetical protein